MTIKLIMNWDIQSGKDQDYFEFVMREWMPSTTRIGLRVVGAWYSVYTVDDEQPRIMAEAITEDMETMRTVLTSPDWKQTQARLMEYVDNYSQKVVYATGDFQV